MNENRNEEAKLERTPVSGMRDLLSVLGKSPDKEYRFVKDNHEDGARIQTFMRGGWDFVRPGKDEEIKVGQSNVYRSKRPGKSAESIVRFPSGSDAEWLYLMQIKKEWYDEDQQAKIDNIRETESQIKGKRSSDDNELGQYGNVKVTTS